MKKTLKIILSFVLLAVIFACAIPQVKADNAILGGLTNAVAGTDLEGNTPNLPKAIGQIIQIFLGFLGVIAVVLIIYAGFMWMTAGGDTAKVDKARKYIINAIIGIVIIMASYIIASYVIEQVSSTLKSA